MGDSADAGKEEKTSATQPTSTTPSAPEAPKDEYVSTLNLPSFCKTIRITYAFKRGENPLQYLFLITTLLRTAQICFKIGHGWRFR